MNVRRKRLIAGMNAAFLTLCLLAFGLLLTGIPGNRFFIPPSECQTRNAASPEAPPVYPGAQLVRQAEEFNNEGGVVYTLYYETHDQPEDVAAFFSKIGAQCREMPGDGFIQSCYGDAQPFGGYHTEIDYRRLTNTRYTVRVEMGRCSARWREDTLP